MKLLFEWATMLACAVFYYRLFGERAYRKGLILGTTSVLVWFGTRLGLHWGWFGCIGLQAGIYCVLTMINLIV